MVNMEIVFSKLTIRLSGYYIDEVVLKQLLDGSLMVSMDIFCTQLPIQMSGDYGDVVVLEQLLNDCRIMNLKIVHPPTYPVVWLLY